MRMKAWYRGPLCQGCRLSLNSQLQRTSIFSRAFANTAILRRSTEKSPYARKSKDSAPQLARPSVPAVITKNMPFFKFNELLQKRFSYLLHGSKKVSEIYDELNLGVDKKAMLFDFRDSVVAQPPSTYAGQPQAMQSSKNWQSRSEIPTWPEMRQAYESGDIKALDELLISKFALFSSLRGMTKEQTAVHAKLADMTRPADWYPVARGMQRELHLHVGPTNSGKTYHALQRLKQAKSGIFAGPLRLLAHEVYERFNKEGIPCNLTTGEERRVDTTVPLTSSTIEMVSFDAQVDVMVIDEIQMIADYDRGPAWTAALLGAPAKEIHMCGEASVVELVTKIAETMGENVTVHEYKRLGTLEPLEESLGGTFKGIREGDAVVAFSRMDIFNVKRRIEENTGFKCAVVYGALPPETRAQQAALFNDPESEYKVIVASDAIGMGLNLSIKRVIFETVEKFDGQKLIKIPAPQIKQIAGRAGRFKKKAKVEVGDLDAPKDEPGYVTTLRDDDLPYVREALATPTVQLKKAMLRPPVDLVEAFTRPYPEGYRLSLIMGQLKALSQLSDLYALRSTPSDGEVLDLLHPITQLSIRDRFTLLDAPLKRRSPGCVASFLELAEAVGAGDRAEILELKKMNIDLLDNGVPTTSDGLRAVEELHHQLTLYMWLHLRMPGVFPSLEEVVQLRIVNEQIINEGLDMIKARKKKASRMKRDADQPFVNAIMMFEQRKAAQTQALSYRRNAGIYAVRAQENYRKRRAQQSS